MEYHSKIKYFINSNSIDYFLKRDLEHLYLCINECIDCSEENEYLSIYHKLKYLSDLLGIDLKKPTCERLEFISKESKEGWY